MHARPITLVAAALIAGACSGAPPEDARDFEPTPPSKGDDDDGEPSSSGGSTSSSGATDRPPPMTPPPKVPRGPNAPGCSDPSVDDPMVTFDSGPVIAKARIWDLGWGDVANGSMLNDYTGWLSTNAASPLRALGDYGVPGAAIEAGTFALGQKYEFTGQKYPINPAATVTDADIRGIIDDAIARGKIDENTDKQQLYVVFLAPGVNVNIRDGVRTCTGGIRGYHGATTKPRYYAVVPDCGGGMEGQTRAASEMIAAAITDPTAGTGWRDRAHGSPIDIAALCATHENASHKVGTGASAYAVACLWSKAKNSCQ